MNTTNSQELKQFREFSSYSTSSKTNIPPASSQAKLDETVINVREAAWKFAALSIEKRIALLESMQQGIMKQLGGMIDAGCKAKNIELGTNLEAEEWAAGYWGAVRQLRLIRESLQSIYKSGNTPIGKVKRTIAGNLAVQVYPNNAIDGMLFKDVTVDVYMQPHITEKNIESDRASFYKKSHQGKVVFVLGAGNLPSISIMDVLTKMFNEGKVCILKMNPVNAYLGP